MEKPSNLILVIFGATGDLTSRKLVPALYSLRNQGLMPEKCALIGVGRREKRVEEFRKDMENAVKEFSEDKEAGFSHVSEFAGCIDYHRMDYLSPEDYEKLRQVIEKINTERGTGGNVIFYMATPPSLYETISTNLSKAGHGYSERWLQTLYNRKAFRV